MKQIPFYKGIAKKVIVSGPAIIPNQNYKCVVFSSLTDDEHTIFVTNNATALPRPDDAPSDLPTIGTVTFTFPRTETVKLKLGDNNLAVYDVLLDADDTTDRTMYKVYEARVLAADSIANHDPYPALEFVDGYLVGGHFDGQGYIVTEEDEFTGTYINLQH